MSTFYAVSKWKNKDKKLQLTYLYLYEHTHIWFYIDVLIESNNFLLWLQIEKQKTKGN